MLTLFESCGVEFLLIGGLALAAYDEPRATKDLDLWLRASAENARKLFAALKAFDAPLHGTSPADFEKPGIGLQIGVPPSRIDLLTKIDGIEFEDAWPRREQGVIDGLKVPLISLEDLIANKRAAGRPQDRLDVKTLEALRKKLLRRGK